MLSHNPSLDVVIRLITGSIRQSEFTLYLKCLIAESIYYSI